ncbi:MAG: 3'(2'),5'-bisphosphate nucleotidase CysQ [Alphaproteobacteria bacterium]|nr:3'(2'),5'-bisphosphate nucleotidase CysQ [Alphaproteobacteria bacterium]
MRLLEQTVREAGALARSHFGGTLKTWNKKGGSPVSEADLAINTLLEERLRPARPDYAWLSEESADDKARLSAETLFIVDPIDGTSAFIRHRPQFTICAAVVHDGRPLCGVVFNPILDEFFLAARGLGAQLNGTPIRVSDQVSIAGCRMLAGQAIFRDPQWHIPPLPAWPQMHVENRSSIAYRMALVASGRFDAALVQSAKHEWDLAAADVIVTEAGGRVSDHSGRPFRYNGPTAKLAPFVCAGPTLHAALLERLKATPLPK